ncbi:MAG TPA: metallopeptidase family protein [Gaiellaceae bacterium]|nr:metallopeptidase family protein [Gaiellaceae bacterium]
MEFEDQVETALDELPPEFAEALENVAVVVADENPEEPTLFGVYSGLGPGRDHAGALPDEIVIYRRPLERAFRDPEELRRQIRITVLHEIGHYFGLDEERIRELGYG